MISPYFVIFFLFYSVSFENTAANPRNKRCIVVQKQSGTHGDSNEGTSGSDEESRQPASRPKHNLDDVENFDEKPKKYRKPASSQRNKNYKVEKEKLKNLLKANNGWAF